STSPTTRPRDRAATTRSTGQLWTARATSRLTRASLPTASLSWTPATICTDWRTASSSSRCRSARSTARSSTPRLLRGQLGQLGLLIGRKRLARGNFDVAERLDRPWWKVWPGALDVMTPVEVSIEESLRPHQPVGELGMPDHIGVFVEVEHTVRVIGR